jgi:lysophospholipase
MAKSLRGELTSAVTVQKFSSQSRYNVMLRTMLAVSGRNLDATTVRNSIPGTVEDDDQVSISDEDRKNLEKALYPVLLCNAAASNDLSALETLVSTFGSTLSLNCVDYDGRTPLHIAACEGHYETIEYLLLHGSSVHILDRFGHTPLFDAIQFKKERSTNILVKAGAHFNDREKKEVTLLLHHRIILGDVNGVELILKAGLDVNASGFDGKAALHYATLLLVTKDVGGWRRTCQDCRSVTQTTHHQPVCTRQIRPNTLGSRTGQQRPWFRGTQEPYILKVGQPHTVTYLFLLGVHLKQCRHHSILSTAW